MYKIIVQIIILILFTLLGELIAYILPFSFPGNLIGLILLFLALLTKLIKPVYIKETSQFLQKYMSFLFVPLCVGLMVYFDLIQMHWLEILLVLIISTTVTFISTAWVANRGAKS